MFIKTTIYPQPCSKRPREVNAAIQNISQKFARIDQLTLQEARRVFFESNPIHFNQALEWETYGDLQNIRSIHKKAEDLLDLNQNKEHAILDIINKVPDVMTLFPLFKDKSLSYIQNELNLSQNIHRKTSGDRDVLCSSGGIVDLLDASKFKLGDFVEKSDKFNKIFGKLILKIVELTSCFERKFTSYKFQIGILRNNAPYNVEYDNRLHHDYTLSKKKKILIPEFVFFGMLSDKEGSFGWNGGDLIVQNDNSLEIYDNLSELYVNHKKEMPFLRYEYSVNKGILLQNQKVIHDVTSINHKSSKQKIERLLLRIMFYENPESKKI